MIHRQTEKPIAQWLHNYLKTSSLQKLIGGGKTLTTSVLRRLHTPTLSLKTPLCLLPLGMALFVLSCEKQLTDDSLTRAAAADSVADSSTLVVTIEGARWSDDGDSDSSSGIHITIHPEWNDTNNYEF